MKKMKATPPVLEQKCPACGGAFTINATSRKKRVQCPQCREVVDLADPAAPKDAPASAPEPTAPEWAARCDVLQARIEALEQQVEALSIAPRPHSALLTDSSPMSREQLLAGDGAEVRPVRLPAEKSEARELFRTARSAGGALREIAILVNPGDAAGHALADKLAKILASVGWNVGAVRETQSNTAKHVGLVLSAGPALPIERITATLNALGADGFGLNFQVDPERGDGDAVLLIGASADAKVRK